VGRSRGLKSRTCGRHAAARFADPSEKHFLFWFHVLPHRPTVSFVLDQMSPVSGTLQNKGAPFIVI
jgi:hypothetical protein